MLSEYLIVASCVLDLEVFPIVKFINFQIPKTATKLSGNQMMRFKERFFDLLMLSPPFKILLNIIT